MAMGEDAWADGANFCVKLAYSFSQLFRMQGVSRSIISCAKILPHKLFKDSAVSQSISPFARLLMAEVVRLNDRKKCIKSDSDFIAFKASGRGNTTNVLKPIVVTISVQTGILESVALSVKGGDTCGLVVVVMLLKKLSMCALWAI